MSKEKIWLCTTNRNEAVLYSCVAQLCDVRWQRRRMSDSRSRRPGALSQPWDKTADSPATPWLPTVAAAAQVDHRLTNNRRMHRFTLPVAILPNYYLLIFHSDNKEPNQIVYNYLGHSELLYKSAKRCGTFYYKFDFLRTFLFRSVMQSVATRTTMSACGFVQEPLINCKLK